MDWNKEKESVNLLCAVIGFWCVLFIIGALGHLIIAIYELNPMLFIIGIISLPAILLLILKRSLTKTDTKSISNCTIDKELMKNFTINDDEE